MSTKKYKVLIICGGGIFGALPAHFLGSLPMQYQTLKGVDLLCGCSIGGILACAYASGKPFNEVDIQFQDKADDCFSKRFICYLNLLAQPTYDNDSIDEVLKEMIGDIKLGEVRNIYPDLDLIIPALNITDDKYKVFDNIRHDDDDCPLADIAGFTSAAPSYFSGRPYKDKCMVDGGLIDVAPLLTATTALKAKRNIPFEDMDVLMIGCGKDIDEKPLTLNKYNGLSLLGIATDVVVPYVTLGNEMATRYWGDTIGYNSFTYFNPVLTNGELDNVKLIPGLIKDSGKYIEQFTNTYIDWITK